MKLKLFCCILNKLKNSSYPFYESSTARSFGRRTHSLGQYSATRYLFKIKINKSVVLNKYGHRKIIEIKEEYDSIIYKNILNRGY